MGVGNFSFIQEAFKGFLKCLGLEVENYSPPPQDSTTYEPAADDMSTTDSLVDILSSTIGDIAVPITAMGGAENNSTLVTIDEIINMSGGKISEAHYVELTDGGNADMTLLTTRLISNGGGGKTH